MSAKNILVAVRRVSLHRAMYPATNASRLVSFALTRRFLGRFRTDSKRWRTYPRLHEGRSGILYVVSALVMSYFAGAGERGTSQATG